MAESAQRKLNDLVNGMDTAMMITRIGDRLEARPMRVAAIEDNDDLYFATAIDSGKVREIEEDHEVALSFQDDGEYVFVQGAANVTRHAGLIERLWSESWRVWFPKGRDDPSLCLLKFAPREAVYWDTSGTQGMKYAFAAAKAYVKGERPKTDQNQHGRLRL